MIEDKELDELMEKKLTVKNDIVDLPSMETDFSKKIEDVKQNVLQDANVNDQAFVESVKKNVKEAVLCNTENERKKAEYEGQKVDYASEQLDTMQLRNQQTQQQDAWENRRKSRQFSYDGVKPIMEFVGIKEPINVLLLTILTIILLPLYLVVKVLKGTIGALIAGAENENRPKAVKGFLWTIFAVGMTGILVALGYLFLKWQNII